MQRRNLIVLTCGLALSWGQLSVRPTRAENIVFIFDEHGHRIYINSTEPPKPTRTSNHQAPGAAVAAGSTGRLEQKQTPPAKTATPDVARLIEQMANRFQVDPQLVHAIIRVESEYNPRALSRKGAMGLMQLHPTTAQLLGVKDAFDPKENIEGGVRHLRSLLEAFGGNLPLSLAAYNAGQNAVLRSGGVPAFSETRSYVRRVTSLYGASRAQVEIRRYVDSFGVIHFTNID